MAGSTGANVNVGVCMRSRGSPLPRLPVLQGSSRFGMRDPDLDMQVCCRSSLDDGCSTGTNVIVGVCMRSRGSPLPKHPALQGSSGFTTSDTSEAARPLVYMHCFSTLETSAPTEPEFYNLNTILF